MGTINPCIIYQRLRPSAPEASDYASREIWPRAHELLQHKGYTICGLYGDSEFAPPFCGSSEIRPGYESALVHARQIAAEVGSCTLVIGNADSIGGGDPFLPTELPASTDGQVQVALINFHLRPDVIAVPLRTAWRWFDRNRKFQTQPQILGVPLDLVGRAGEIEIFVRRDPKRRLASLYVANPKPSAITLRSAQLLQRTGRHPVEIEVGGWRELNISGRCGVHLLNIYQGESPWIRQLRFKHEVGDQKRLGSVHLTPSDLSHDRLQIIWESRG